MILSSEETALLLAELFQRGGQKRARVSEKTVRLLSKRQRLRRSFIGAVEQQLDDLGLILVDLDRGGFGIMPSSSLEGASVITAKKYLPREELARYHGERSEQEFRKLRRKRQNNVTEAEDDDAA